MITKKTTLNEILYRFDDAGVLKGAHVRTLTRVVDDETGEIFAAREDSPMTLEQAQQAGIDVPSTLNDAVTAALTAAQTQAPAEEAAQPLSLWSRITAFFSKG